MGRKGSLAREITCGRSGLITVAPVLGLGQPRDASFLPPFWSTRGGGHAERARGGGSVVLEVLGENRETWWKGDEGDSLAITKGMALSSSGV